MRRAGLDYWHLVDVRTHENFDAFERTLPHAPDEPAPRLWLFSGRSQKSYLDVRYRPGDVFVFGKESLGLPAALLDARRETALAIPLLGDVRSHNLANAVAIVLYEALRQTGALRELDYR